MHCGAFVQTETERRIDIPVWTPVHVASCVCLPKQSTKCLHCAQLKAEQARADETRDAAWAQLKRCVEEVARLSHQVTLGGSVL